MVGALVCFVVSVHWWHHRTHYDVTEAYRAPRNIITVHLNNGATRADLRGIPKHCEMTAKAGRQSTIYTGDFDAIFLITRYGINPYPYSGFLWARCNPWDILNNGSGIPPSGFTWQATSAHLAGGVIQVWINSSPSNPTISHFKAQLAPWFLIQHLICTYWIQGILYGYAIRSGWHPSGSQRPGPPCGRPCGRLGATCGRPGGRWLLEGCLSARGRPGGRWLPEGCLFDRIA